MVVKYVHSGAREKLLPHEALATEAAVVMTGRVATAVASATAWEPKPAAAPAAVKDGVSRREARILDGAPVRRLSDALLKRTVERNLSDYRITY